ncbi:hypothetical protein HD806DRAFT_532075 [Xylariaceae sp. AK1471]|nr:hypothetical protein HD806DRAFT_532075 [Xylariaceae sp. AK1471]
MAGFIRPRRGHGHGQYLAVLPPQVPLLPDGHYGLWPVRRLNPLPLGEEFASEKVLWESHILEQQVAVLDAKSIKRTSVGLYRIHQDCTNGLALLANVVTVAPGSLTPQEAEEVIYQVFRFSSDRLMIQISEADRQLYIMNGVMGLDFEDHYSSTLLPGCSFDVERRRQGTIGKIIAIPTVNDTEYYGITCSHVLNYNTDQSQRAFSPATDIDSSWKEALTNHVDPNPTLPLLLSQRRQSFNPFLGMVFAASPQNATLSGCWQDIALIKLRKGRVDPSTYSALPKALIDYSQKHLRAPRACIKLGSTTGLTYGLEHDVMVQVTHWANNTKTSDTREHAILSSAGSHFSLPGDSGSMIYRHFTHEEIGIVWGGLGRNDSVPTISFQAAGDHPRLVDMECITFYMPAQAVTQSVSQFFAQRQNTEQLASLFSGLGL